MTFLPIREGIEPAWQPSIGPPSSLLDVFSSARETQDSQRNAFLIEGQREAAYDAHTRAVREATGIDLGNPLRDKRDQLGAKRPAGKYIYYGFGLSQFFDEPEQAYQRRLEELAGQRPELRDLLRPDRRPDFEVVARAARAERTEAEVWERRGDGFDLPGYAASFAGSFVGMLRDPVNASTMFLGPMSRVGLGGRQMLWSALKNGAANAGIEAAQAPFVQSWRARAGLDHGLGHAATDVGMAFLFGGAVDLGGRAAWRGARRWQGRTPELDADGGVIGWRRPDATAPSPRPDGGDPASPPARDARETEPIARPSLDAEDALDRAAREAPPSSRVRQAADGDIDSLHMIAREAGLDQDPAYRGARAAAHVDDELAPAARVPTAVADIEAHYDAMIQALRAANDPDEPYAHVSAPPEVPRMTLEPAPDAARESLQSGAVDPVEAATLLRQHPDLAGPDLPRTPALEMARDLARLPDPAFGEVLAGGVSAEHAALAARVAPAAEQARLIDVLRRAQPQTEAEAAAVISEALQRPRAEVQRALMGDRGADAPAAPRLDEPSGPQAQAQIARLEADLAPQIERLPKIEELKASLRAGDIHARAIEDGRIEPSWPRRAYSGDFLHRRQAVRDDLMAEALKTLPSSVRVAFEDRILVEGYELHGYWDRADNLLAVALDAQAMPTFRHERIHALRSHGLFTDREWRLLVEQSRVDNVRGELGHDVLATYSGMYGQRIALDLLATRVDFDVASMGWVALEPLLIKTGIYDPKDPRGSLSSHGLWDEARLQSLLDEEAVASLAERWRTGERFGAKIDAVLERVVEFLRRVANVLKGHGFQTVDDIFRRIETGEISRRKGTLPDGSEVEGVWVEMRPEDMLAAIKAYHGSPHDFDRFDKSKIGTGEGAQAYGRGLYFAENEGVAKSYKEGLGNKNYLLDGKPLAPKTPDEYDAHRLLQIFGPDIDTAIAEGKRHIARGHPVDVAQFTPAVALLEKWKAQGRYKGENTGRMYEVNIKADPDQFLDWDKPLSQQPAVRALLERIRVNTAPEAPHDNPAVNNIRAGLAQANMRRDDWQDALKRPETVEALRDAGIPGIKYLDQQSRAAGQGSRNYVVFDDSLIEIVAKDGVPVQPLKTDLADATRAGELETMARACKS